MLSAQVFRNKWIYRALILGAISFGIWRGVDNFLYIDQKVTHKEKIGQLSILYITESNAGATTSNVYKYYLYSSKEPEEIFLKEIRNGYAPFLVTTDPNVKMKIGKDSIHLNVSGKIYNFKNLSNYIFIYLDSSPL